VQYLDFLTALHAALAPSAYLEIGIRNGRSLALADCPAVGIDPYYDLGVELGDDVRLFRETSDEYFLRERPRAPLGGRRVDLAFIDGMHLAEFALRDFIYVERHSHWPGVIVFDDMFPRNVDEAARDRHTGDWTGDVYKLLGILERERPDLELLRVGTAPTGLLLVLNVDPSNRVLEERYDALAADVVRPDPQDVPAAILARERVLDPHEVLASKVWGVLREARERETAPRPGRKALRRALRPGRLRRLRAG
jgi:hypothetical protein